MRLPDVDTGRLVGLPVCRQFEMTYQLVLQSTSIPVSISGNLTRSPPPLLHSQILIPGDLYFNSTSLLVSTSGNLTRPPPPLLTFFPLAALANTGQSMSTADESNSVG